MKIVTSEFQQTIEDLTSNLQSNDFPDAEEYNFPENTMLYLSVLIY